MKVVDFAYHRVTLWRGVTDLDKFFWAVDDQIAMRELRREVENLRIGRGKVIPLRGVKDGSNSN